MTEVQLILRKFDYHCYEIPQLGQLHTNLLLQKKTDISKLKIHCQQLEIQVHYSNLKFIDKRSELDFGQLGIQQNKFITYRQFPVIINTWELCTFLIL